MLFAYSHGFDKCQHTELSEKLSYVSLGLPQKVA